MILLDTDVCVEMLRGNQNVIESRIQSAENIAISFMTVAELFYGSERSGRAKETQLVVEEFLLSVTIIQSDLQVLKKFGQIKSHLYEGNILIPDADILVASTALIKCNKLITGNLKHFKRIENLKIEDWIR